LRFLDFVVYFGWWIMRDCFELGVEYKEGSAFWWMNVIGLIVGVVCPIEVGAIWGGG